MLRHYGLVVGALLDGPSEGTAGALALAVAVAAVPAGVAGATGLSGASIVASEGS